MNTKFLETFDSKQNIVTSVCKVRHPGLVSNFSCGSRSGAVGRWFPPGTPVSSTGKLISSSFHRLDMTLAVAEALNPNKPNQTLWQLLVIEVVI